MNYKECKIKDDNEIIEEENKKLNFRRFTSEEIEKKHTPFERIRKNVFPFIFQKKRETFREDMKISLDDIITKISDISLNSLNPILAPHQFSHHGMVFEPTSPVLESVASNSSIVPEFDLDELSDMYSNTPKFSPFIGDDLKFDEMMKLDG
jgi:hypothetical protein